MSSPQNPPTAHDVLRRVGALRSEPPENAQVTLDFGQYPIPDIPYLTIVKWALSSSEDWPLLAERRAHLDTTTATRGLSNDELRRILFDDLKRSLWQPTPDGLTLDCDDQLLQLAVAWSPRALPPDAHPIFATLGSALKPSTVGLVDARPDAAEAFRHAIAAASGPSGPPKPGFRVDIGQLTLPAADYAGTTNERRALKLYYELKRMAVPEGTQADPRVQFFDRTLTIEFDNDSAIALSGLIGELLELARLPQFGEPPIHPGAPPPGTRRYESATDGAELRLIEHAFAVPGYRAHRQAQRRNLATGLSYDTIARAYRRYDAAFTPGHIDELNSTLQAAGDPRSYVAAFTTLFQHGGLVIGEYHEKPDAYQFAIEHMAEMKDAGQIRFICETFDQDYQEELDRFVFGKGATMSSTLESYVQIEDTNRDHKSSRKHFAVGRFLRAARENGVRVIAAEHPSAYYSLGAGHITNANIAELYDQEKRLARYNWVAAARRPENDSLTTGAIDVHITGASHANTTEYGHPGISQLTGFPAVIVANENGSLRMRMRPETRRRRLKGVPAHAAVAADPLSSSHSTTSPSSLDKYRQHQEWGHSATEGISI